jgi:hypothetical protein
MLLVVEKVLHEFCWHVWQKNWYDTAYINHKQIHLKFNYVKSSTNHMIFSLNLSLHNFKHAPKVTLNNACDPYQCQHASKTSCYPCAHDNHKWNFTHSNQKKVNDVLGPKVMYFFFFVNEFCSLSHALRQTICIHLDLE